MGLSKDPEKRKRQMANLDPQARAAKKGNRLGVTHGAFAKVIESRVEDRVKVVIAALAEDAPLRAADGGLPVEDLAIVRLLAECLCRTEDVSGYLRDHGILDPKTKELRRAVDREGTLRAEAASYLDALGMTPRARARLGLDLARTVDLATAMSETDPVKRAELLRQPGVIDGD